jgi:hypothetical protein
MAVITETRGMALLEPIRSILIGVVDDAFAAYRSLQYDPEVRRVHNARTASGIINAHVVHLAEDRLRDILGTRLMVARPWGRVLFTVDGEASISFKKLGQTVRPSNYPTRHALRFLRQLSLFQALPTLANLVVGYKFVDPAETLYEIWAVCPGVEHNHWAVLLKPAKTGQLPLPFAPVPVAPPSPKRRVFPRDERRAELDMPQADSND